MGVYVFKSRIYKIGSELEPIWKFDRLRVS